MLNNITVVRMETPYKWIQSMFAAKGRNEVPSYSSYPALIVSTLGYVFSLSLSD